jgi:glycosyltransferase involved in cell wall biosynthesis
MVATRTLEDDLAARGFRNLMRWSRGVDHELFRPHEGSVLHGQVTGPVFMYVGRVAVEKNIAAFLDLDLPGSKVVVGDGPQLAELKARYRQVLFTGAKSGEDLARHYASADVVVFPSLTDTFGNVVLEALACGVPVAAFPVMGPLDILGGTDAGVLDDDLRQAALAALAIPSERARALALEFTWERSTQQFIDNCVAATCPTRRAAA